HRVEHQLDAHEDDDRVLAHQDADRTDGEQRRGEHQVVGGGHSSSPSPAGRACSVRYCSSPPETPDMTDSSEIEPSGSRAGVPIASWLESTPGPGSGWGRPERIRARASAFCVGFGSSRSTWASTIAPIAATISSAEVSSKAIRYLVKSRLA